MSLNLNETTVAIFNIDYKDGNWLANLNRGEGDHYVLEMRFRWYVDDKAFDSDDRRSFYEVRFRRPTNEAALEHVRAIVDLTVKSVRVMRGMDTRQWELVRGARSMDDFIELLGTMPGMHVKKMT